MANKVTTAEAAELLKVNNKALFASYRAKLPGLPKPCMMRGNHLFFDKDEIIEFGKLNDVNELLKALDRQRYANKATNYKPRVRRLAAVENRPISLENVNVARLF